ncbi:DUF4209 domain-containing protein [Cystobacter fuscus]|nr:DUF4209 domain-containing protein [Cystobacter fuscus]
MTRTAEILGSDYDAPAQLPEQLEHYAPKRGIALAALKRAEAEGDAATVEVLHWELGLIDLWLSPAKGVSPYRGGTYEAYAKQYRISESTVAYGRERAKETRDVVLKLHYLSFVLLRSEPRGRTWIELQWELLTSCREYVSGCIQGSKSDPAHSMAVWIDSALSAAGPLMARPGVIRNEAYAEWSQWILGLAEESLTFPREEKKEYLRYRWLADYLEHLTDLPASAASPALQERSLGLLGEAAVFYESNPLEDVGSIRVAEAEAKLRRHWGEEGDKVHERKVRRTFAAIVRRAEFFEKTGKGFIAADAFREARQLVERERRFFTADDIAQLQRAEQAALNRGLEAGEIIPFKVSFKVPSQLMDYTQETPDKTAVALAEQAVRKIPNRKEIAEHVKETSTQTPLLAMARRTVISPGKVVGESKSPQTNLDLDVESRAMLQASLFGAAVSTTVARAAEATGLTEEHLIVPLFPLALDEDSLLFIRRGCERLIAQDFISATHILVLRIEDILRRHFRRLGVDTTEFKADVGDGTSRTDDVPFGKLMRLTLPDGRSVKEYLGSDLWEHLDSVLNSQTGLNLRNEIAHGLAGPQHCTAESAGIALALLYQLAYVVWLSSRAGTETE